MKIDLYGMSKELNGDTEANLFNQMIQDMSNLTLDQMILLAISLENQMDYLKTCQKVGQIFQKELIRAFKYKENIQTYKNAQIIMDKMKRDYRNHQINQKVRKMYEE